MRARQQFAVSMKEGRADKSRCHVCYRSKCLLWCGKTTSKWHLLCGVGPGSLCRLILGDLPG
eukprot:1146119-Pelagomonas_calceolata.AAC.1